MANDLGQPVLGRELSEKLSRPPQQSASPKKLPLRILTIASEYLNQCLRETCEVVSLTPDMDLDFAFAILGEVDFLLVETAFSYSSDAWNDDVRVAFRNGTGHLTKVLDACKKHEVPTALWVTLDVSSAELFSHLPGAFSHTFYVDPKLEGAWAKLHREPMTYLPPAISPALHNPLFHDHDGSRYERRDFGVVTDAYRELNSDSESQISSIFDPALDYLFWIIESRFTMRNNNARLNKDYRRRFLGSLSEIDRVTLVRNSSVFLSGTNRADNMGADKVRNMMEAMASKTAVLSNALPFVEAIAPHVKLIGSAEETRSALEACFRAPHFRRMTTHLAYREVMTNHTYADRLQTMVSMLKKAPASSKMSETPLITAIVPTMRPELLPFVLSCFRQQNYENLEMVVVLHSDVFSEEDVKPLLRKSDRVRVIRVPESQSVSTALNVGISEANGEYWARIDDDDYYGPNYFTDAMLNRKFYDFDICGKSQWMIFFESLNQVCAHKKNWASHSINTAIAGGTFLVRKADHLRFDPKVQGFADVDFIGRAVDAGNPKLVSGDEFNFLQIRRRDVRSHTWTANTNQINRSAIISDGIDLARIGI